MEIRGYAPGHMRLPLSPISEENRERLQAVLADLESSEETE
jgi:dihydrodipicolinate synthase/N-acetylneuraminate lyase